jgi:hypothetical protein
MSTTILLLSVASRAAVFVSSPILMLRLMSAALFLIGYIFRFGLHNVEYVLDGSEIRCSECLAYHSQCSRDHSPHMARRHGLALRAVDAVQRVAKVLSKFSSVLAEFEWPVFP